MIAQSCSGCILFFLDLHKLGVVGVGGGVAAGTPDTLVDQLNWFHGERGER